MTHSVSVPEFLAMQNPRSGKRTNKLGARKTKMGERTFDSKAEALRWRDLEIRQLAGEIRNLRFHSSYSIPTGIYTDDSSYDVVATGEHVIEDVKGVATDACRLRLKQMAQLGKLVTLVTKESQPQYWGKKGRGA